LTFLALARLLAARANLGVALARRGKDAEARAIMAHSQEEEYKHFGMDLEFLLRRSPVWRATLKDILFTSGDIVSRGEQGEHAGEQKEQQREQQKQQ